MLLAADPALHTSTGGLKQPQICGYPGLVILGVGGLAVCTCCWRRTRRCAPARVG